MSLSSGPWSAKPLLTLRSHRDDRPQHVAGGLPADPAQGTPAPRRPAHLHRHRRHRITAFLTSTPPGMIPSQVGGLELRPRQHARVEGRIREAKASGLRNLPCRAWDENCAWLEAVLAATDLVCWAKLTCFAHVPSLAAARSPPSATGCFTPPPSSSVPPARSACASIAPGDGPPRSLKASAGCTPHSPDPPATAAPGHYNLAPACRPATSRLPGSAPGHTTGWITPALRSAATRQHETKIK